MRFLLYTLGWVAVAGAVVVAWTWGRSEVAAGSMLVGIVFLALGHLLKRD